MSGPVRRRIQTPYQQQQSAPHAALLMAGASAIPHAPGTVFLSHCDTSSFLDEMGHAVTVNGSPGNPAGATGFGNCYENTSGNRSLQYVDGGTGDWTFAGTVTPFLVEFMMYPTRTGTEIEYLFDMGYAAGGNRPGCKWYAGHALGMILEWNSSFAVLSGLVPTNNAWNYIAFGRTAVQGIGLWVNGVASATVASPGGIACTDIRVGNDSTATYPFIGKIDELRVRNVCPLTPGTNYTPPTAPFP